jgi:OPA family sugar phosphate sensor protein UhpC-like MFS transporter
VKVFNFFKPAPHIPEIEDPQLIQKTYKYWRLRTFYAMYIGYALYYFTRKSFTFAMPSLHLELGLSKLELGLLGSILSLSYGASKFISGIAGDKSNPRYFMSVGLILTGIFNLFFGFSSTMLAFAIFWGLNGWFQGWGWPGCAKLLTHWYSHSERGRWWSVWSTSHNIGGTLIPILVAFCAAHWGWRSALYVPGCTCILMGLFLMNRLRDTPQSLGLPPVEQFRGDYAGAKVKEQEISVREILFEYVLRNKYIWILAGAQLFNGFIRTAVNDWSMFYLIEMKNYTVMDAGLCVCLFEVGGFVGMLSAGWASDKLFDGRRNPINAIFTAMILVVVYLFQTIVFPWPVFDACILFAFGFAIFGPQMLIGLAAAELSHKKAAATATGFAGCFAYLGAAMAGGPLGALVKVQGWDGYLMTLCVCAALGTLIVLPLWSIKVRSKELKVATD